MKNGLVSAVDEGTPQGGAHETRAQQRFYLQPTVHSLQPMNDR